jgi:hypothetical protein
VRSLFRCRNGVFAQLHREVTEPDFSSKWKLPQLEISEHWRVLSTVWNGGWTTGAGTEKIILKVHPVDGPEEESAGGSG